MGQQFVIQQRQQRGHGRDRAFQWSHLCKTWLRSVSGALVTTVFFSNFPIQPGLTAPPSELDLAVGIVQRFGKQPTDQITLEATKGDRLTLRFKTGDQPQTVTATTVKMDVVMQPLAEPSVQEWVVLSTHRSFESAEYSAEQWKAQGLEVEVAQPDRWQVWAKRDVYNTPLLRRFLVQSLQAQGNQTVYIDTQVQAQLPKASWVVNGYRYSRDELEITAGNRLIQVKTGKENPTNRLYAGSLRLQPNSYGTYTLVNQVPLETYLRGVVPHEIGVGAPQPAVEAQAILARTYALRNLRRFAIDNYELCADTQCQVYWGLTGTDPKADQAIADTRNLVLTYQNELVDALYSSTTGGVTAAFGDVWNGAARPYLQAVVDSVGNVWDLSRKSLADETNFRAFIKQRQGFNEEGWRMFRWQVDSNLSEMTEELQKYLKSKQHPLAGFKTIQQVQVTQRSPAGRVLQLSVKTDQGIVELSKDDILNAFYAPNSTLFYLDPVYGADKTLKGYRFVGGGLGHGVGLSQTGSYRLGELGWSNQRILNFYYPGTQVQPISQAITFWQGQSKLVSQ